MNFKAAYARLVLVSVLIFANPGILNAQSDPLHRLPAGTRLRLKLDVELSSKVASVNDTFTCVIAKPFIAQDVIVLPVGTVVSGRVRSVTAAGSGRNGKLDVVFESLRVPMLPVRPIEGELTQPVRARSSSFINAISIAGGAIGGTVLGLGLKGGGGAAIGAGAGAAAGTLLALFRKGKNARIGEDEEFEIVLKKDVTLPVLDY